MAFERNMVGGTVHDGDFTVAVAVDRVRLARLIRQLYGRTGDGIFLHLLEEKGLARCSFTKDKAIHLYLSMARRYAS